LSTDEENNRVSQRGGHSRAFSQIQKGADSAFSAPFWTPRTQQKPQGGRSQIQKGADFALFAPFWTGEEMCGGIARARRKEKGEMRNEKVESGMYRLRRNFKKYLKSVNHLQITAVFLV
jgi:hypothetical protein